MPVCTRMRVADLSPNKKNPRTITDTKLKLLKKALHEFGDLSGVVFNRKSKQLVGGHQRVNTLDPNSKIVITKKYPKPTRTGTLAEGYIISHGERYTYRVVSWDRHREMAANIAANKGAGEWDLPQLADWMRELDSFDVNYDMDLTMFDVEELSDFEGITVREHTRISPTGVDEDDVPDVQEEPQTKRGDIYQLGRHRLTCGDSTAITDVDWLMNGERAGMTFTSPPYNADKDSHMNGRVAGFDRKYGRHYSDNLDDDEFRQLLVDFTSLALEKTDYVFVNLQLLARNRIPVIEYQHEFRSWLKDVLIWNKSQCPPNIVKGAFNTKWEYVLCFSKDSATRGFPVEWRGQYPNVVETENNSANDFAESHKAGFPVALPVWFIEKLPIGDVYDPFGGTGTTVIACEKTDRRCFMMEIDPHYCDIIVARWEKYTGGKAVLEKGKR